MFGGGMFGSGMFGSGIFGNTRSSHNHRKRKGQDILHTLEMTLEELYNGRVKRMTLTKDVLCLTCSGYEKTSNHYQ